LLERAVQLLPHAHRERLRALPQLAWTLTEAGRFQEAREFIEELAGTGDPRWTAYAAVVGPYNDALSGRGSFDASRPGFAAARKTFEELGDDVGLGRALFMQGGAEWNACRAARAIEYFREALPSAERAGDVPLLHDIWATLIGAYAHGPMPLGEAEREIRAIVETSPGLLVEASAHRALARLAAIRGDFESARSLNQRGRDPLAEAGLPVHAAATAQGAAFIESLAGDPEEALRIAREGFDRLSELGEHAYASTLAAVIASLSCHLGRNDEAQEWVDTARELSPQADAATLVWVDSVEAILLMRRGQQADAERVARRAVEQAESTDFWPHRGGAYEALAEVLWRGGHADEAREAVEEALRVYDEKGAVVLAERVRALFAEL
jgi:tetratricopeptide (TPR) repeat protein